MGKNDLREVNIAATYIRHFFESVFVTKCHFFFESKKKIFFHFFFFKKKWKKFFFFWVKKKKFFFIFFYSKKKWKFFHFLIQKKSLHLLFTFSQIFLASRNRRSPFFRSWKFWVEKIFSFAFHFLSDFSRQKKLIESREIKKTSIWLLQKLKIEIRFWSQSCRKIFTENSSSFPEREIFSISNRIERNNLSICS